MGAEQEQATQANPCTSCCVHAPHHTHPTNQPSTQPTNQPTLTTCLCSQPACAAQISAVVKAFGYPLATALAVGVNLSQIGEFVFVLLSVATQRDLLDEHVYLLLMGKGVHGRVCRRPRVVVQAGGACWNEHVPHPLMRGPRIMLPIRSLTPATLQASPRSHCC